MLVVAAPVRPDQTQTATRKPTTIGEPKVEGPTWGTARRRCACQTGPHSDRHPEADNHQPTGGGGPTGAAAVVAAPVRPDQTQTATVGWPTTRLGSSTTTLLRSGELSNGRLDELGGVDLDADRWELAAAAGGL
jgi:hypothetical protein